MRIKEKEMRIILVMIATTQVAALATPPTL